MSSAISWEFRTEHYTDSSGSLSWTAMAGDDRKLLIDAFTRTAAERGYARTTVEEVAWRAGVPPSAFHAHFPDMGHCLMAAYDAFCERLTAQVGDAVDVEAEWSEQVRAAVAAAVEFLVETASRARLFAVEATDSGPAFLERYFASIEGAADRLREGRDRHPHAAALPTATESVLIGGIVSQVRAHLLAEESARLPELEPELVELLLRFYVGEQEARRVAGRVPPA